MNIRSALSFSFSKSLYLSTRFHGQVVVTRGTRIRLAKGARIELAPGARLRLGMRHPLGTPLSLQIRRGGRLTVHGEVLISSGTRILIGDNAHLEIGDQTFIHYDGVITCWEHIVIGAECGISWNVNILDGNGHDLTVGASNGRRRAAPRSATACGSAPGPRSSARRSATAAWWARGAWSAPRCRPRCWSRATRRAWSERTSCSKGTSSTAVAAPRSGARLTGARRGTPRGARPPRARRPRCRK